MEKRMLLEIAVACLERAIAAERAGADRLELCEQLEVGGVTPKLELVRRARSAVQIPLHVLVRPRAGDFDYTPSEFLKMKQEIAEFRNEGVQGIVTGILQPDSSVDIARTKELVDLAAPLKVTFHRAFDCARNVAKALEDVILTGANRILTSGGAPDALQGASVLRGLIEQAASRLIILPGGGIHPANIAEVIRATGAREIHTGLGTLIPYSDLDTARFESAIRACVAAL